MGVGCIVVYHEFPIHIIGQKIHDYIVEAYLPSLVSINDIQDGNRISNLNSETGLLKDFTLCCLLEDFPQFKVYSRNGPLPL